MNSPLLPAAAAALCAAVLLVLMRHFIRTPSPPPTEDKQIQEKSAGILTPPSTPGSDVEKGETPPPTVSYFSDVKIRSELVEEVWPPVERETEEPTPTLGALPDVALVWGMDYRPTVDRRPLMAYSTIASALGVEDEPVHSSPVTPITPISAASEGTDTRPMRSRSLISGIVSDWNSLSQSEQQAWATLSESRTRSRGSNNSRTRAYDS